LCLNRESCFPTTVQNPAGIVTQQDLAGALSCNPGSSSFQIGRLTGVVHLIGRPPLLTADADQMIFELATTSFVKHEPLMIGYLVNQIQYLFEIAISGNTMSYILRRMPNAKTVMGIPMERSRGIVDPKAIDAFYDDFERALRGIPREFIINVEETRCADFVDAGNELVIVPATDERDEIAMPVDRSTKRASLIGGIAADGTHWKQSSS
jgi:hypothetical protein